jgi:hypothetical protein
VVPVLVPEVPVALLGGLVVVVPVVVVPVVVVPVVVVPVVVVPVVVVPVVVVPVVVVPVVVVPVVVSVRVLPVPVGRLAVPPSLSVEVAEPGVASEEVFAGVVDAGATWVAAVVVTVAAGVVAVVAGVVVVAAGAGAGAAGVFGVTASRSWAGERCASAAPASRACSRASRTWRAYEPSPAAAPPTPKIAHTSVTTKAIEPAPLLRLMIRVQSADRSMPGLRLPGSRLVGILGLTPAHSSYFDKCPINLEGYEPKKV